MSDLLLARPWLLDEFVQAQANIVAVSAIVNAALQESDAPPERLREQLMAIQLAPELSEERSRSLMRHEPVVVGGREFNSAFHAARRMTEQLKELIKTVKGWANFSARVRDISPEKIDGEAWLDLLDEDTSHFFGIEHSVLHRKLVDNGSSGEARTEESSKPDAKRGRPALDQGYLSNLLRDFTNSGLSMSQFATQREMRPSTLRSQLKSAKEHAEREKSKTARATK